MTVAHLVIDSDEVAILARCVCEMSCCYLQSPTFRFSLRSLFLSFVVMALILYGRVEGFIEIPL